jgi:hypothetical protein
MLASLFVDLDQLHLIARVQTEEFPAVSRGKHSDKVLQALIVT